LGLKTQVILTSAVDDNLAAAAAAPAAACYAELLQSELCRLV